MRWETAISHIYVMWGDTDEMLHARLEAGDGSAAHPLAIVSREEALWTHTVCEISTTKPNNTK